MLLARLALVAALCWGATNAQMSNMESMSMASPMMPAMSSMDNTMTTMSAMSTQNHSSMSMSAMSTHNHSGMSMSAMSTHNHSMGMSMDMDTDTDCTHGQTSMDMMGMTHCHYTMDMSMSLSMSMSMGHTNGFHVVFVVVILSDTAPSEEQIDAIIDQVADQLDVDSDQVEVGVVEVPTKAKTYQVTATVSVDTHETAVAVQTQLGNGTYWEAMLSSGDVGYTAQVQSVETTIQEPVPTSQESRGNSSSGNSAGVAVGAAVGVCAALGAIGLIAYKKKESLTGVRRSSNDVGFIESGRPRSVVIAEPFKAQQDLVENGI